MIFSTWVISFSIILLDVHPCCSIYQRGWFSHCHAQLCDWMGYSLPSFSLHWSVLPFPSPEDLPDPEIESESLILQVVSCLAGGFFTDFIPFNCQIIFHCLDGPHFVYPFTSSWVFGLFVLLCYMNKNIHI